MATWARKQINPGTEYRTENDQIIVRQIEWRRPGFHAGRGPIARGWAIFVKGKQDGPAHPTAKKAMEHAELPGVWPTLIRDL